MKMSDEIKIEASRERVFAALNDLEILRQAIPGCEQLERTSETELTVTVQAKIGPVKARFQGAVVLSDIKPPESYTISGKGKGGVAGFAEGTAQVTLRDDDGGTILAYQVEANVGGKLAQIGARLIEGTSKKLAGEFFEAFAALVPTDPETAPPVIVVSAVARDARRLAWAVAGSLMMLAAVLLTIFG